MREIQKSEVFVFFLGKLKRCNSIVGNIDVGKLETDVKRCEFVVRDVDGFHSRRE